MCFVEIYYNYNVFEEKFEEARRQSMRSLCSELGQPVTPPAG